MATQYPAVQRKHRNNWGTSRNTWWCARNDRRGCARASATHALLDRDYD